MIGESPTAYRPIKSVMNAQGDLVEIVHILGQVVRVKG
jgi:RNA-splicing ligase RtcB